MNHTDSNSISNEKRAELLLQHHQDTFQVILYNTKIRNRLFIYSLFILALLIFDAFSPNSLTELFNIYIKNIFGDQVKLNFSIIFSAIWFLLLCLVIEYYKRSIHVDRQFRYLGNVEKDLNTVLGAEFITREGKAYDSKTGVPSENETNQRPLCLKAIGPLYTYVFPITLSGIIIWKIVNSFSFKSGSTIFNGVIGGVIIIYSILYLCWIKSGKKKR